MGDSAGIAVAIYAAVLSTIVFLWDIAKWLREGPRLRFTAKKNTFYEDSPRVNIVKTEYGEQGDVVTYCHIEVSNVGNAPTTILNIEATFKPRLFKKSKFKIFLSHIAFQPHGNRPLPATIAVGEIWSARVEMNRINNLAQYGTPVIRLKTSDCKGWRTVKVT